jgi:hypothetical protein
MVILAHFLLVRLKLTLKEKAPELTLPQAVPLLKASLPQPEFALDKTVRIVNYYQKRHEAARQSHRKKRGATWGVVGVKSRCSISSYVEINCCKVGINE